MRNLQQDSNPRTPHQSTHRAAPCLNQAVDNVADNVKALYRRGKAHVGAWNPKEARADFERVAQLDLSMAKAVQKDLVNLDALEKQKVSEDRALFEGKMFG